MIISCTLFLTAIAAAAYAILASMSDNIERIYEVIEQRDGVNISARKITVGALRSHAPKPVMSNNVKLRRPGTAKRKIISTQAPQRAWLLAA